MSNQVYQLGGYGSVASPSAPITSPRAPVSQQDIVSPAGNPYQLGQIWRVSTNGDYYIFTGGGNWELQSSGGGAPIQSLNGDTGNAIPTAGAITLAGGTGLSTIASGSTVTFNVTGMGEEYTVVTANTSMTINLGYITNKAGTAASMLLPATAAVGSSVSVVGLNATGWVITQAAGQTIHMNSASTTTGAGGSLASTAQYNTATLVCTVANTDWTVLSSEGVLTVT